VAPAGDLMATRVRTAPRFTSGKAEVLFEVRIYVSPAAAERGYDISPDGKRFLNRRKP